MNIKLYEELKKQPVWTSAQLRILLKVDEKTLSVYLSRWIKKGYIKKIIKGYYTIFDDPYLIGSYIFRPSYIGLRSALSFHQLTTQLFHEADVITPKQIVRKINPEFRINFFKIDKNLFFGYKTYNYGEHSIFVSVPEKTILDLIYFKMIDFLEDEIIENLDEIDLNKLYEYSKRFNKKYIYRRLLSIIKAKYEETEEEKYKETMRKLEKEIKKQ